MRRGDTVQPDTWLEAKKRGKRIAIEIKSSRVVEEFGLDLHHPPGYLYVGHERPTDSDGWLNWRIAYRKPGVLGFGGHRGNGEPITGSLGVFHFNYVSEIELPDDQHVFVARDLVDDIEQSDVSVEVV